MEQNPEFEGERGISLRSILIACLISMLVGVSSAYVAIFLSALPWPVILSVVVSYVSLIALDVVSNRRHSIHEANVAQAGGSVGGLIAAGVAFTIPAYIVISQNYNYNLPLPPMSTIIAISIVGALLGVALSLPVRRITIDREDLPFPEGRAGAEVLIAIEKGGHEAKILFIFGLLAAAFTIARWMLKINILSWEIHVLSVVIIIQVLPLLMAAGAGYIMGPVPSFSWFAGAIAGWVILMPIFQVIGYGDFMTPVRNFGMGIVLGAGIGFLCFKAFPRSGEVYKAFFTLKSVPLILRLPLILSIVSYFLLVIIGINPLGALLGVIGAWIMSTIAGKTTGETNIDPLEQFGLLVGIFTMQFLGFLGVTMDLNQAILLTAFVSIASALAGDIGHDFKSAKIIGTRPADIAYGDMIASIVGGIAASLALIVILKAHPEVLSLQYPTAAQSKLVASVLVGKVSPEFFIGGILAGFLLEGLMSTFEKQGRKIPLSVIAFGVGIFLGFSLAILAAIGGTIRLLLAQRGNKTEKEGIIAASGILGGEGIVGFILALLTVLGVHL
ncbi:MAG: OPT/YSL family transporter [Candidatus Korarchaeota archaeon]|nr:OPT/YSL family transporter [Thermoproteota archaeon]